MTFAARIVQACSLRKDALGLLPKTPLPPDERDKVLNECCELFIGEAREQFLKEKRPKKAVELGDAEWVQMLEGEPSLAGVNIKMEINKCQFWCKQNKKQPTRRRITNWLNRAERVVDLKASGATYANGLRPVPPMPPEPNFWREVFPDFIHVQKKWPEIERASQIYIVEQMALRLKQG